MTLPASGTIKLSDIAAEFGVSPPYSLSDFYGVAAGVPVSGDISLTDFYGVSAETVTVNNQLVAHIDSTGTGSTYAGILYESDGDVINQHGATGDTDVDDWLSPKTGAPGAYEIRAILNSGTPPAGSAVGSWLPLTSNRSWILSSSPSQSKTCQLTIEIRSGATVLDSGTITLTADSSGF